VFIPSVWERMTPFMDIVYQIFHISSIKTISLKNC